MINKFNGKCVECGTFCKAGTATWFAGHGVVCDRCNGFDSAAATKKADPHTYSVPAPVVVVAPVISEEEKRAAEIERISSALEVNRRMVRLMRESGKAYAPIAYAGYEQQIAKLEAELAALQPVVVEEEIVTEAEIAASEDAIETATETVSDAAPAQTLELYRLTVRCSDCCRRTKSAAKEIAHYPWCTTLAQDPELLRTLQDKIALSIDKRRQTKADKLAMQYRELRAQETALFVAIGGRSPLGIHKISGSTGLHTVRAYEGSCTCPGHKAHGHCKHVPMVRQGRETLICLARQIDHIKHRLLAMEPRATEANAGW